jgi:hypothetical protein
MAMEQNNPNLARPSYDHLEVTDNFTREEVRMYIYIYI